MNDRTLSAEELAVALEAEALYQRTAEAELLSAAAQRIRELNAVIPNKTDLLSSNEQGPLWTPTPAIERLMRQCKGLDTVEVSAKVLEGICFDSLQWRAERLKGGAVETSAASVDAARYRFLRQPGNAIVYAKDRNAWGEGASGHVKYETAEQLDTAVDAARGAVNGTPQP